MTDDHDPGVRLPGPPPEPIELGGLGAGTSPPDSTGAADTRAHSPFSAVVPAGATPAAPEPHAESPEPPEPPVSTRKQDQIEGARSPSSYYVPAPRADTERISVRIDKAHLAAGSRLVESGVFDWASFSDFVRWAVWNGLQIAMRDARDEELSNEIRVLSAIQRRIQSVRREEVFIHSLGQVKALIVELVKQDARGDAMMVLRESLADAQALTISRFKARFVGELKSSFPDLILEIEKERGGRMP